jgi:hypothetical protein
MLSQRSDWNSHAVGAVDEARLAADIPRSVGSSDLGVVAPGRVFVIDGPGLQAAVEDADEAVAELAEGGLMADPARAQRAVVAAGAG